MAVTIRSLFALVATTFCCAVPALAASTPEPIRVGWQTPWATQGQIVMSMRKTNALELVGQDVQFVGFAYGAPLNSAALAGKVDVLMTADQPAIALLARDPSFRIVSRLMYNRACIYVPRLSALTKLGDLAGRTVMGPTGAAAERIAVAALARAGVNVAGMKFAQLDMPQQVAMLRRPGAAERWSGADALYGFDPFPVMFEEAGYARMLDCGNIVSVVLASNELVTRRRPELEKFLAAYALGWHYYATRPNDANRWFIEESRLDVSGAILDRCAAVEPNRSAPTLAALRFDFTDADTSSMRETARFLKERGVLSVDIDPARFVDLGALQASLRRSDLAALAARLNARP